MSRPSRNRRDVPDPELTLGGRCAAAIGSLLFSVPAIGLLWLFFNSQIMRVSDRIIPGSYLGAAVVGFALFAFVFPKAAPAVIGKLYAFVVGLGRY